MACHNLPLENGLVVGRFNEGFKELAFLGRPEVIGTVDCPRKPRSSLIFGVRCYALLV